MTGRESDDANALMNRLLLEFEGEPGVTDNGTLIYSFPELMRTSRSARGGTGPVQGDAAEAPDSFLREQEQNERMDHLLQFVQPAFRHILPWPSASPRDGGPGKDRAVSLLLHREPAAQRRDRPMGFLAIGLGIRACALSPSCSSLFPFFAGSGFPGRTRPSGREALRGRSSARSFPHPPWWTPASIRPQGHDLDPGTLPATARRILERLAAQLKAEPVVQEGSNAFAYRFPELERELADLEAYRKNVDVSRYEVGKDRVRLGRLALSFSVSASVRP